MKKSLISLIIGVSMQYSVQAKSSFCVPGTVDCKILQIVPTDSGVNINFVGKTKEGALIPGQYSLGQEPGGIGVEKVIVPGKLSQRIYYDNDKTSTYELNTNNGRAKHNRRSISKYMEETDANITKALKELRPNSLGSQEALPLESYSSGRRY